MIPNSGHPVFRLNQLSLQRIYRHGEMRADKQKVADSHARSLRTTSPSVYRLSRAIPPCKFQQESSRPVLDVFQEHQPLVPCKPRRLSNKPPLNEDPTAKLVDSSSFRKAHRLLAEAEIYCAGLNEQCFQN